MANLMDLANYVQQQGELGRQQGQRNRLASLSGAVIGGDPAAFREAAAIDPKAATSLQDAGDGQLRKLRGFINYVDSARAGGNTMAVNAALKAGAPFIRELTGRDGPSEWTPDMDAGWEQLRARVLLAGESKDQQTPTDVRSFQMMTQGLSSDDRERARRINLGLDGRASSSGFSQVKVTGADGRERVGVLNGRTGQIDLPDGTSFNPQTGAISPTQGAQQVLPQGGGQQVIEQDAALANQMIAAGIPEAQVDAFLAQRASQASGAPQSWGAAASAPAQPITNNPAAFVGRSPEEQAAATQAATLSVQQQFLPQELAMRTDAAIRQAGGSEMARGEAEAKLDAISNLPRVMQESTNAIRLVDQALNHPGLSTAVGASGRADPRNYLPGTEATNFRVLLDQIKGGTFLQAFQSLKGGGAITEVEGTKAEQAIARLNRDQSEEAFRQSLQDLREVAQSAITRAQRKAQAAQGGQGAATQQRTVVRTGMANGRRVVQYSDGSVEYGN